MKKTEIVQTPVVEMTEAKIKGHLAQIPLAQIRLNPKNYRKVYDEKAIQELAGQLKRHGVLSSLMLRPIGKNKYEVVVGERRFRAANLAGLKDVPAKVVELNDLQVLEIQLDENMNRENPHPLDEAEAIRLMLDAGYNIEEISLRLGKSKSLIYNRIKLSELIILIKEMFVENVLNIQMALEIASLSSESQTDLFNKYLKDWKKKDFKINGLMDKLNHYKFNLKNASFDINDPTLVLKAGDCMKCPFNSATLKSLFPEFANIAVCNNKTCYTEKCSVSLEKSLEIFDKQKDIELFVTSSMLTDIESVAVGKFADLMKLPGKLNYEIDRYDEPVPPLEKDYMQQNNGEEQKLDQDRYINAMKTFKSKTEKLAQLLANGDVKKGLLLNRNKASIIYYYASKKNGSRTGVTAKDVQDAIKAGTVTPELMKKEIERLETKEARSKELDKEKMQMRLHDSYVEQHNSLKVINGLTKADQAAARWIIFDSMDYRVRETVISALFPKQESFSLLDAAKKYELIAKLTDKQFAFLIRNTLSGMSESKSPEFTTGYFLYKNAIDAGMDVKAIETEQIAIAQTREQRVQERIADLKKQIRQLAKNKNKSA